MDVRKVLGKDFEHYKRLLRLAQSRRITGDHTCGEDLFHDWLMKVMRSKSDYEERTGEKGTQLISFATRGMRNKWLDVCVSKTQYYRQTARGLDVYHNVLHGLETRTDRDKFDGCNVGAADSRDLDTLLSYLVTETDGIDEDLSAPIEQTEFCEENVRPDLWEAMNALKTHDCLLFQAVYFSQWHGQNNAEVAVILGKSRSAVKSLIKRGLDFLKQKMSENE